MHPSIYVYIFLDNIMKLQALLKLICAAQMQQPLEAGIIQK
jgi:hypothetical protein